MRLKDDEKAEAIARAAYALVAETGLSGLTMAAVAKAAGIATGTLYLYHSSKQELIDRLYERSKKETAARMLAGVDPAAPYRARFRRMWENAVEFRLENHEKSVFQEQYVNSPWFSAESRDLTAKVTADWVAFLREGQAGEIIKPLEAPLLVSFVNATARETARLLRAGRLGREDIGLAFGLCWDGINA